MHVKELAAHGWEGAKPAGVMDVREIILDLFWGVKMGMRELGVEEGPYKPDRENAFQGPWDDCTR